MNTRAIIFVVDSNDTTRVKEAKDELWKVLESPELASAILLVFANKQDLPNAMNSEAISNALELNQIASHPWHVQPATATDGVCSWLRGRIRLAR